MSTQIQTNDVSNGAITQAKLGIAGSVNFNNNQALSFRVENLTSDPAAGNAGRLIWRTDTLALKIDDGSAFTAVSGGGVSIGGAVGSGTAGSVLFVDGSGNLGQDNSNLFWDDTNNRLGINSAASPSAALFVKSNATTTHTIVAQAISSQSVNVFETRDSSGVLTFGVGPSGGFESRVVSIVKTLIYDPVSGLTPSSSVQVSTPSSGNYANRFVASEASRAFMPLIDYFFEQTSSFTAVPNNRYWANSGSLVTMTLPATAVTGDRIRLVGHGSGGWAIAQNSGQTIHFGSNNTTTGAGGSVASTNRYDSVELLCTVTDTDFVVIGAVGTLTLV